MPKTTSSSSSDSAAFSERSQAPEALIYPKVSFLDAMGFRLSSTRGESHAAEVMEQLEAGHPIELADTNQPVNQRAKRFFGQFIDPQHSGLQDTFTLHYDHLDLAHGSEINFLGLKFNVSPQAYSREGEFNSLTSAIQSRETAEAIRAHAAEHTEDSAHQGRIALYVTVTQTLEKIMLKLAEYNTSRVLGKLQNKVPLMSGLKNFKAGCYDVLNPTRIPSFEAPIKASEDDAQPAYFSQGLDPLPSAPLAPYYASRTDHTLSADFTIAEYLFSCAFLCTALTIQKFPEQFSILPLMTLDPNAIPFGLGKIFNTLTYPLLRGKKFNKDAVVDSQRKRIRTIIARIHALECRPEFQEKLRAFYENVHGQGLAPLNPRETITAQPSIAAVVTPAKPTPAQPAKQQATANVTPLLIPQEPSKRKLYGFLIAAVGFSVIGLSLIASQHLAGLGCIAIFAASFMFGAAMRVDYRRQRKIQKNLDKAAMEYDAAPSASYTPLNQARSKEVTYVKAGERNKPKRHSSHKKKNKAR